MEYLIIFTAFLIGVMVIAANLMKDNTACRPDDDNQGEN